MGGGAVTPKQNKAVIRILEQIFEAEIHERLPKQFRPSKKLDNMAASGLIEKVNEKLPGWPTVWVSGWVLTEYGRRTYCQWAATQPTPTAP